MTNWRRVSLDAETVAGRGILHRTEELGSVPVKVSDYADFCGAVAYRATDGTVSVYVPRKEGER